MGGKKRSGGRLKVLELEFVFVLAAEIIHVLDSIVRCASSNVFIVFFLAMFFSVFFGGGDCPFLRGGVFVCVFFGGGV